MKRGLLVVALFLGMAITQANTQIPFTDAGQECPLVEYDTRAVLGYVLVTESQIVVRNFIFNGPFPARIMLVKEGRCDSPHAVELYHVTDTHQEALILTDYPRELTNEHVDTVVLCTGNRASASTGQFPPPN